MQFLAFFVLLWCLITVALSQIDLSSSPIDFFQVDSQAFADEPQLEEADLLDQWFGSDLNIFPDDYQLLSSTEPDPSYGLTDVDLNQIVEPYSSFLTAGDIACDDSSDASSPQLFGKIRRRRGDTCQVPPAGGAGGPSRQPGDEDEPGDLGFTNFASRRRVLSVFPSNEEICPVQKYFGANIPVCREPIAGNVIPVLGVPWVNLRDVVPRMSNDAVFVLVTSIASNCLLIKICKVYFSGSNIDCAGISSFIAEVWCCQLIEFRVCDHIVNNIPLH